MFVLGAPSRSRWFMCGFPLPSPFLFVYWEFVLPDMAFLYSERTVCFAPPLRTLPLVSAVYCFLGGPCKVLFGGFVDPDMALFMLKETFLFPAPHCTDCIPPPPHSICAGCSSGAARGGSVSQERLPGLGGARDDPRPLSPPAVQQTCGLGLRSSGGSGRDRLLAAWFDLVMVGARERIDALDVVIAFKGPFQNNVPMNYLICDGTVWFTRRTLMSLLTL